MAHTKEAKYPLDFRIRDRDLSLNGSTGAWRGKDYIASLVDGRSVWYDGNRIDVCNHPKFRGTLLTLAEAYDSQFTEQNLDKMTFVSEVTGNRVSYSYLAPRTKEELDRKWANTHQWMGDSLGLMARLPDFMANVVVGLYDFRSHLGKVDAAFGANAERYYWYCRENDLNITHAIVDPQIDRSASLEENPDLALRVIARKPDGIVVQGAKQLATLSPYCHEALIYMSPTYARRKNPEHVAWFATPIAAEGLHVVCRESHTNHENSHHHPFSNRFDEQDGLLVFDKVFIPNERIFLLEDSDTAFAGYFRLNAWSLYVGQIRFYHRVKTFLGTISLVADAVGLRGMRDIDNLLGELVADLEMIRMGLNSTQAEAKRTDADLICPASTEALDIFSVQVSARMSEIMRIVAASGMLMQPSLRDLQSPPLRPLLDRYMRGRNCGPEYKSLLFRSAWELVGGSFGGRQEIYERYNRGDPIRNKIHLFKTSPERVEAEMAVKAWLEKENISK